MIGLGIECEFHIIAHFLAYARRTLVAVPEAGQLSMIRVEFQIGGGDY